MNVLTTQKERTVINVQTSTMTDHGYLPREKRLENVKVGHKLRRICASRNLVSCSLNVEYEAMAPDVEYEAMAPNIEMRL